MKELLVWLASHHGVRVSDYLENMFKICQFSSPGTRTVARRWCPNAGTSSITCPFCLDLSRYLDRGSVTHNIYSGLKVRGKTGAVNDNKQVWKIFSFPTSTVCMLWVWSLVSLYAYSNSSLANKTTWQLQQLRFTAGTSVHAHLL